MSHADALATLHAVGHQVSSLKACNEVDTITVIELLEQLLVPNRLERQLEMPRKRELPGQYLGICYRRISREQRKSYYSMPPVFEGACRFKARNSSGSKNSSSNK